MRRAAVPAGVLVLLLILAAALFGGRGERLADAEGRRVIVADGDTLKVWGETIRLAGVDAVEAAQFCLDDKGTGWSCGQSAKEALSAVVAKGGLRCVTLGRDRFGWTLARCSTKDGDVGAAMVAAGWAVSDGNAYAAQEQAAREGGRGIWAGTFEAPSVWRERNHVLPRPVEN